VGCIVWACLALALASAGSGSHRFALEGVVSRTAGVAHYDTASAGKADPGIRCADLFALSSLLTFPEVYHDFTPTVVDLDPKPPQISSVCAFGSQGPPSLVMSGDLVRVTGRYLEHTAQIIVDGRKFLPLVVGPNTLVVRLDGSGEYDLWLTTYGGLVSPKVRLRILRLAVERGLPPVLEPGQLGEAVLRIDGTTAPVGLLLEADFPSVSLGGLREATRVSSGGNRNLVRFTVRGERAGPFRITYRLGAQPSP
jgi:hypothetical protein